MGREGEAVGGKWEAKELGFHSRIFHLSFFILSFKVLAYFFLFSGLFTVLNLIFLHSFKNFWHQGRHICLEGLVDNV